MVEPVESDPANRTWWARNARPLKTLFRLLLGVAWLTDGVLKFTSGYINSFLGNVQTSQANAPSWLSGWYSFWVTQATAHGTLIISTVGVFEIALGLALLLGFMRKIAYVGGVILSLLIWAVPEGFGGPYTSGGGGTDVGTGIIYAVAFLGLILINATYGPSRYSLDYYIERHFPRWARIAEFNPPAAKIGKGTTGPVQSPPSN
jgi:nitrite reductase (NO-forming)